MKCPVFLTGGVGVLLAALVAVPFSVLMYAAGSHVLRVGSHKDIPGQFQTIQAAVNAAQPGDWILIGPGDYHEHGASNDGVLVTTSNIHIRGMDRNRVIVDGTLPGGSACSSDPAHQTSIRMGADATASRYRKRMACRWRTSPFATS